MTFNNKQELIDKIKEKQASAKIAYEQTFTMLPSYETKEKEVKNKAYMEAYEDVIALIDSAKIVVYPEEKAIEPCEPATTRNDELDARQYAVEGLIENQNLVKKFFGTTIKVHTKKRIVGSTTPFESMGKIVSDSGKYISIKQEDGGNVIIDKENIESIETMSATKQDMKIKIIISAYYSEFEKDITDFIKNKNIVDIKFSVGSDYGMMKYCVMIIYKEDKSE